MLQYPANSEPFKLKTDAFNVALSAVFSQGNLGRNKPICYASHILNDTERRYSTIEKSY